MVLKAVPYLLGNARFAGQGLECPPQVAIGCIRDDAAVTLSPDETVERAVADRLRWGLREGKNQPNSFGLIDSMSSAASDGTGTACG